MPAQTIHTRSPALKCFSSDIASGYATWAFTVIVFAVVSSDTSSPFHVYVSSFVCDDCARPDAGLPIAKTIARIAICIHLMLIRSSSRSRLLRVLVDRCQAHLDRLG